MATTNGSWVHVAVGYFNVDSRQKEIYLIVFQSSSYCHILLNVF